MKLLRQSFYTTTFVLFLLTLGPSSLWAKDSDALWDITAKLGGTGGAISAPGKQKGDPDRYFSYGGVLIGFALNRDLHPKITGTLQYHLVADIANSQVSRQGVDVGIAYHVLGGAMRLTETYDYAQISSGEAYNLSLLGRTGLRNYGASSKEDPNDKVSGSLLEILAGIGYRWSPTTMRQAYGIEVLATLFSIPASVDRLETTGVETILFWRFCW
jgi:hypothetical protein